jgi:uncharacterized membrane protein
MSDPAGLRFFTTPGMVALSVFLVMATAGVSAVAWRRGGGDRALGLLELVRLSIAGLVAVLLNQPEWVEPRRPEGRPVIAVLHDASRSMDTQDVPAADGLQSRRSAVAELTTSEFWRPLAERFDLVVEPFSAMPAAGTDIGSPLAGIAGRFAALRAVVLTSDGDWNEGPAPLDSIGPLAAARIPILAVPVGSQTPLPDIDVSSVDCPTVGVAGKPVRIPFSVQSTMPEERTVTVRLEVPGGRSFQKPLTIPAMGRVTDWFHWTPEEVGDGEVTLLVDPVAGELLFDNNRRRAPISIRREKLRVLVVEGTPRWEYRYLRNALVRDPGVQVSCLLFQPGLERRGGGGSDAIDRFPSGLDELSAYDVVFLGDVEVGPDQLSPEDCRLLAGLVEYQASGLVFMPGWRGGQETFSGTPLEDLCPVVLDPRRPDGMTTASPRRLALTEEGRASLLTKLADTPEENLAVWESLPGVQWYAPVIRAKAGSEVLAVHEDAANEFGRIPLLVTRSYGAGKVLYMATDGAWRWRKGVEDRYHYRFWGQVVRWMAYRRNMARGERMSLSFTPERPQLGRSLAFDARVADTVGGPLTQGEVTARITAPSGSVDTVRFVPPAGDTEWGVFAASYLPREPGRHEVVLGCRDTGDALETSFVVQGSPLEPVGRPARPEVLAEVAQATGGRIVPPSGLVSLVEAVRDLPEPPPELRRMKLWAHPVAAAALIGLLGLFWIGRKWRGLL